MLKIFSDTASHNIGLGDAAIYSILSILLVFLILLVIIGITSLIFTWLSMIEKKTGKVFFKKNKNEVFKNESNVSNEPVSINDEDMMAAVLVASIDYRNEIKKDVKVVSVKEIK